MAYGSTPDAFDEYLQMSEHTARDALFFFNMCIIELYMPKYLRKPTLEDVVKIQQKHNNVHGFPGMLGSIDCMHWEWKNCPVSWQGQYGRGDKKYPTIMLEAVASQDLWIWHAFYGMAGTLGLIQQPARAYEVTHYVEQSLQTVWIDRCQTQRRKAKELRDKDTHISLQQNLMNHIWREVEEASEED
ncbi:probable serine/threonine-protein kinase PBL7 [Tanacetum coccineum]